MVALLGPGQHGDSQDMSRELGRATNTFKELEDIYKPWCRQDMRNSVFGRL